MQERNIEEYHIEFILSGKNISIDKLTKTLTEIGYSVIIDSEGEDKFRINIRSTDPKKVFDRTSRFGKPTHIRVDNLFDDRKE